MDIKLILLEKMILDGKEIRLGEKKQAVISVLGEPEHIHENYGGGSWRHYYFDSELALDFDQNDCLEFIEFLGGHYGKLKPYIYDISVFDAIQNLFPDRNKDFVVSISENEIAIVKEVEKGTTTSQIEDFARSIIDTLMSEHYVQSTIGIGTIVKTVKDLAFSFKEAQVALEASKVFDSERLIVSYENLGIARLVYQLPTTLCKIFLKEVFRNGSIESLDQETLFTIQRFFENNLNISETSRKLFIHRNTLVYRLDKIKRLTALDLREFDDAIVFKIALMVRKYLNQVQSQSNY